MDVQKYDPGSFCWYDLSTTDSPAAKAFYGSLFGWEGEANDAGEGMVYTIMKLRGKPVAGLYENNTPGAPPRWDAYVAVADVDAATSRAESLGATVRMGPADAMGAGRMSAIQDPTGAVLCLWQPLAHPGSQVADEPGAFCWVELATTDVSRAADFYTSLFGWQPKGEPGTAEYVEWQHGGRSIAGMMDQPAEVRAMGMPSFWMPYVQVTDCDGTVARAQQLGARVYHGPMDIPDVGRFAVIGDPQGAGIAVVQLK